MFPFICTLQIVWRQAQIEQTKHDNRNKKARRATQNVNIVKTLDYKKNK